MPPLLVYPLIVSVFSLYSLVNACADAVTFRRPTSAPKPRESWPSLSVLIPARNEAAVIARCVQTLRESGYLGALQILVLDDRSDDATATLAADAGAEVIVGGELWEGWKGKPNALRQLAEHATGELLLLTDADCVFLPGSLAAAVCHRERTGADCLSLMPQLTCESFWEHVVIPLQFMLVFLTLPVRNVYATKNPAFAAANGAFLLLPRATYVTLGGHEPVKSEMAEDIKFAQHVKKSGLRLVYGDGSTTYSVRMYESLRGIWDGFSKNLFPAMGKSLPVVITWAFFLLTTQVLPIVFLGGALFRGDRSLAFFVLPLVHAAISLGIRLALTVRFRQAWWGFLTQPLGWLIVIAIAANSAYLSLSGKGHSWKGRTYQ